MNVDQFMSICTLYYGVACYSAVSDKRNLVNTCLWQLTAFVVYDSRNVLIKLDAQVASATVHLLIDRADCRNTLQDPVGWHCIGWNVQINVENKIGALPCGAECPCSGRCLVQRAGVAGAPAALNTLLGFEMHQGKRIRHASWFG